MEDAAQTMMVTLLFSDLSGFTAMSENLGAEKMASLLNEYLTEMNEVIFEPAAPSINLWAMELW